MPTEKARPSFYLLPPERHLPATDLNLWVGRIVRSYSEPDANFLPEDPRPFITKPFATTTITNASLAKLSQQHKSFAATLGTSAIQASRQTNEGGGLSFSTSEIVCVRLQDQDGVFDRLNEHPETRLQLAKMLARGGNVSYLVTAALIWRDVTFTHSRETGSETSASIAVPISTIVTGTTGMVLPNDLLDPGISSSRGSQNTAEISGESVGSHIFALQYKIVRRSVLQSFLGKSTSIKLKGEGPDLPSSHSFARQRHGSSEAAFGSDDEDEDEDDESSSDGESDDGDITSNGDGSSGSQADLVDDANVLLEMDEDDVTWADVLEEDEGCEMGRADVVLDGEEMQFLF